MGSFARQGFMTTAAMALLGGCFGRSLERVGIVSAAVVSGVLWLMDAVGSAGLVLWAIRAKCLVESMHVGRVVGFDFPIGIPVYVALPDSYRIQTLGWRLIFGSGLLAIN